jgi:phosphoribosylanthranilate isomerase
VSARRVVVIGAGTSALGTGVRPTTDPGDPGANILRTPHGSAGERYVIRTRVKICGITSAADAAAAVRAGADAVGVVLAPSKREVSISEAEVILEVVPPLVSRVGVFVDAQRDFIEQAVRRLDLDLVQYSGDESPEICASAQAPVLKVIHIGTTFDSDVLEPYRGLVAALLLDTLANGHRGGTGNTFAWHKVHELPAWAPVFVAGGLTSLNVGAAIGALHPYAVDVSSGVERLPGKKDHSKMEAFIAAVSTADAEVDSR